MNRVNFINSISGIDYPEMLVNFFDHFVALKQLVENSGKITVLKSTSKSISFSIDFNTPKIKDNALLAIGSLNGIVVIYQRQIKINVTVLTDKSIQIDLT